MATRDDLLDLMTDTTASEYRLSAPTGDWEADLLDVARQARHIMGRHRWLPALVVNRPALGPHGADLLEHVLHVLARHPAEPARKLEAFALLNGLTALFVQNVAGTAGDGTTATVYLPHVAAAGDHPRIATVLSASPSGDTSGNRFDAVLLRALNGVLD